MKKRRLNQLMDLLRQRRELESTEAAAFLGVSLTTIRRDFEELANLGMARRFHGGLSVLENVRNPVLPIALRRSLDTRQKERLALLASRELPDSGAIFIDGGTTTACLAAYLTNPRLHVITNSVALLRQMCDMPSPRASLTMSGGDFHQITDNLLGPEAIRTLSHYHADIAVISCTSLDAEHLYDDPEEAAAIQRCMMENADRLMVIADSSKLGRRTLYKSIPLEKVQTLVTDYAEEKKEIYAAIRQKGVRLLLGTVQK